MTSLITLKRANTAGILAIVFITIFAVYLSSNITPKTDTIWSLYIATSFVKSGNFDLDEYQHLMLANDYRIERVNEHFYSFFPLGAVLMASPFVYLLNQFPVFDGFRLDSYLIKHQPNEIVFQVEKLIASFLAAVSCIVIFSLARQYLGIAKSIVLTAIFAFGTSMWSVASRGLWQHGPSILCLSLALYVLIVAQQKPALVSLAGFPLAFSYLIRPTNIISIIVFTAYIWFVYRRFWIYHIICLTVILAPFFVYNYYIYSSLLPLYFAPQRLGNNAFLVEALIGNLVSPSRGLFVFSPILILSIFGFYRILRRNPQLKSHNINLYLFGAVVIHWITISAFKHWYAGWSIGPRLFSDMLPYFIYFLIPLLDDFPLSKQSLMVPQLPTLIFIGLITFSIFVHYRCSTDGGPTSWNAIPVDIDKDTHRLWDWSDIQFLRGLCPKKDLQAPRCWYEKTIDESSFAISTISSSNSKTSYKTRQTIYSTEQSIQTKHAIERFAAFRSRTFFRPKTLFRFDGWSKWQAVRYPYRGGVANR